MLLNYDKKRNQTDEAGNRCEADEIGITPFPHRANLHAHSRGRFYQRRTNRNVLPNTPTMNYIDLVRIETLARQIATIADSARQQKDIEPAVDAIEDLVNDLHEIMLKG